MGKKELLVISRKDVASIFKGNVDKLFDIVQDAFLKYHRKEVLLPDKISQIFDENTQIRINCMPASLLRDKVSGVKWISVFPTNNAKMLPNVIGVSLLSEIETGFPLAVIDSSLSTTLRTAAVGCVAAKYLAPSSVQKIGFIGSGEEAKMHYTLLKYLFPSINDCFVYSRKESSVLQFIEDLSPIDTNVRFWNCVDDLPSVSNDSDIIVTAISGQEPVLKADNIKKGSLYIHVGGWEDEYNVALSANKIVCDDWEASKHRTQTLSRMFKDGVLRDSDVYANLADIIAGVKKGRESDNEFIYFNSVGLSFIDINLANEIYKEALKKNIGVEISLMDFNKTSYLDFSNQGKI